MEFDVLAAALSGAMGVGSSLVFAYVPYVKDWYEKLGADEGEEVARTKKRGVMALTLAGLTAAAFGLVCAGWFTEVIPFTCNQIGVENAVIAYVIALGANTATYWGAVRK